MGPNDYDITFGDRGVGYSQNITIYYIRAGGPKMEPQNALGEGAEKKRKKITDGFCFTHTYIHT